MVLLPIEVRQSAVNSSKAALPAADWHVELGERGVWWRGTGSPARILAAEGIEMLMVKLSVGCGVLKGTGEF